MLTDTIIQQELQEQLHLLNQIEAKCEPIELFGEKVLISERTAIDVIGLQKYSSKFNKNLDLNVVVFEGATIISDALEINKKGLKFYQLIKRYKYWKKFRSLNILKKLSATQIMKVVEKVYRLEGIELKDAEKKSSMPDPAIN